MTTLNTLQIMADILREGMALDHERVWIYNQRREIPKDSGVCVTVGLVGMQPYGNNRRYLPDSDELTVQQSQHVQETISVNIFSRDLSAMQQYPFALAAIVSEYSTKLQFLHGMRIGSVPMSFLDTSYEDGAAILHRFTMTLRVLRAYDTAPKGTDYYDQFSVTATSDGEKITLPFAPPEEPPPPETTDYASLMHFDGTGSAIVDVAGNDVQVNNGAAQVTDVKKYGTGSLRLTQADQQSLYVTLDPIGTQDFCFEAWVRPDYTSVMGIFCFHGTNNVLYVNNWEGIPALEMYSTLFHDTDADTDAVIGGRAHNQIPDGEWTHVAFVRHGLTLNLYRNGQRTDVRNVDLADLSEPGFWIGTNAGGDLFWNGHIDDVALTVGSPKYTADFTPPTGALT